MLPEIENNLKNFHSVRVVCTMKSLLTPAVLTLLLSISTYHVSAYPAGPPTAACSSMTPSHSGNLPKMGTPPYKIVLGSDHGCYHGQMDIKVTVSADEFTNFKGFYLQARKSDNVTIVGQFESDNPSHRLHNCLDGENNAVSHSNAIEKTSETVTFWPEGDHGTIHFNLTVVTSYSIFYVNISSHVLKYDMNCGFNNMPSTSQSWTSTTPWWGPPISAGAPGIRLSAAAMIIFLIAYLWF